MRQMVRPSQVQHFCDSIQSEVNLFVGLPGAVVDFVFDLEDDEEKSIDHDGVGDILWGQQKDQQSEEYINDDCNFKFGLKNDDTFDRVDIEGMRGCEK